MILKSEKISAIENHVFLQTTQIDDSANYYYFKNTRNGKKLENISSDTSYIKDSTNGKAFIEIKRPVFINKTTEKWFNKPYFKSSMYIIYLPKDSKLEVVPSYTTEKSN